MKILFTTIILLLFGANAYAQVPGRDAPRAIPQDLLGIEDRGFTTHNRSNIGMFIENRGKLYARSNAIGVSGEFPINSEREYIYQLNPVVLFPGNVIQGRNTANEEWEAEFGFNNPETVRIATSTEPETWPSWGWPVQDEEGNPIIISNQDTFAAYNDSLNREEILGISIYQTGYSFSFPLIRDAVIFTFDVVNRSQNTYEDMFFGMYSDFDIGNRPGTDYPGYLNDRMRLDKDLDFFYYFDNGFSPDWGGPTGMFGLTWVSTPEINGQQLGMTDLHYNLWQDTPILDENPDWFYGVYTSNYDMVPEELWPQFFHPVEPGRRIDDLDLIPTEGMDLVNNSASGPYTLAPGDTLTFVIAVVAGSNYENIRSTVENVHQSYQNNWLLPSAPPAPELQAFADKEQITLTWDNRSELVPDPFTGEFDFQGYRLYRSIDNGRTWDQIDRNQNPEAGPNPVPIAVFDKDDGGIQYSFTDTDIREGFDYWYSLTAYDSGIPGVGSLESAIGNTPDEPNIVVVRPQPIASDWVASTAILADHIRGEATDSVFLNIFNPLDTNFGDYEVRFARMSRPVTTILTRVETNVLDLSLVDPTVYTVTWTQPDVFSIRNENAGRNRVFMQPYVPGEPYDIEIDGISFTFFEESDDPDLRPQAGDRLQIVMGLEVIRLDDNEVVLPLRPYTRNLEFITSDGVGVTMQHNPFRITRDDNRIEIDIQNVSFAALQNEFYRGRVMDVEQDSLVIEILRQSTGGVTNYTIANGGIIDLGRFELVINLTGNNNLNSFIGRRFDIEVSRVNNPTERDIYRYRKESGQRDVEAEKNVLSSINVVPNPYVVSNAWERDISLQQREPERQIRFRNLPNRCTIHIFTIAGERVKTLHKDDSSGVIGWDLRTESGREIAPGIYIYQVNSDIGTHTSRFAVIK